MKSVKLSPFVILVENFGFVVPGCWMHNTVYEWFSSWDFSWVLVEVTARSVKVRVVVIYRCEEINEVFVFRGVVPLSNLQTD